MNDKLFNELLASIREVKRLARSLEGATLALTPNEKLILNLIKVWGKKHKLDGTAEARDMDHFKGFTQYAFSLGKVVSKKEFDEMDEVRLDRIMERYGVWSLDELIEAKNKERENTIKHLNVVFEDLVRQLKDIDSAISGEIKYSPDNSIMMFVIRYW